MVNIRNKFDDPTSTIFWNPRKADMASYTHLLKEVLQDVEVKPKNSSNALEKYSNTYQGTINDVYKKYYPYMQVQHAQTIHFRKYKKW